MILPHACDDIILGISWSLSDLNLCLMVYVGVKI